VRLLIAGGGTGGHLYPGLAVAEEVLARPGGEVLFVGTARGLEARVVPAAGHALELIAVSGLKRVGPLAFLRGLGRLPLALVGAMRIVRRFRPDVVLGVGGYASGPVVLAAALAGYPTAIQEQNSVPGFTNRTLGRFVRAVLIAFVEAQAFFPRAKVARVGNPVRRRFVEAAVAARGAVPGGEPRLLVLGGSQGSRAVNDLVLGAAELLAGRGLVPPIVHQAGPADAVRCADRYRSLGLADRATVRPFIEDMPGALGEAALVIGRAGALTLAELAIVARPAVLVPLPTAADDHQSKNAEVFARAGAAVVLAQHRTTPAHLADVLVELLADATRRQAMAHAMAALARPSAARDVVDRLEELRARERPTMR
jgi:UDP-N-acetylglucosamine--N-acetylmuramyl-(pentapeptide) pyrophosphoryl-undecaprenol N-acetylglucosamine transferase